MDFLYVVVGITSLASLVPPRFDGSAIHSRLRFPGGRDTAEQVVAVALLHSAFIRGKVRLEESDSILRAYIGWDLGLETV